ncbi:MAG TPA: neutral/alkaline non-lysosomal ceramidase N-terminal domain-containing protein [Phycisphaerae bacterium]|nr:neutral/alkaline non-lysosomal ceramidase N-terminal domain-containing protein [Phycisphaerae bacterium]
MNNSIKAGFAKTDITPAMGIRLGGYGLAKRPAESVHDNLYSSALVLEQNGVRCVLISLDWLCITSDVAANIKNAVHEKTGTPLDNIIVCAIHTHTAPNTMAIPGWGDVEYGYVNAVLPAIIDSAVQAAGKLSPAKLGVAAIESKVGVNRRTMRADGKIYFDGNVDGSYDPTMTVIRFVDMQDAPITTVIHYSAHCTAWGMPRIVSRDWAGIMLDRVQKQTGSPAMFVNGAIGDVGPRTNQVAGEGRFSAGIGDGLESVLEVGYRGATDALNCFFGINTFDESPILKAAVSDIEVPVKPLPPLDEVNAKLDELKEFKDTWGDKGDKKCQYEYYRRVSEAYSQPPHKSNIIESRIIAIGPVAFITLPGEPFSSISLRLREGSPYPYTLLLSNANGSIAYIPDLDAREKGGYEVEMESAVNTYLPIENSDEIIVAEGIRKLRQLYNMK